MERAGYGCGMGANAQYLTERGFSVLSAAYSREALANVRKFIPDSRTEYVALLIMPFMLELA